MRPLHKPLAACVHKAAPLPPQGLGYEKTRAAGRVKRRRVKLHKLHVHDLRARLVSHVNTVSPCRPGVGRPGKKRRRAARGKYGGAGPRRHPPPAANNPRAEATAARIHQPLHPGLLHKRHIAGTRHGLYEKINHLSAGRRAARVQNPPL